jgi:hypothetical protein
MLENYICNDRIKNNEAANIRLSFNRKNTMDNSCNDKEEKNSEGENKGDKNDQFEANVNMSACELGKGNVCLVEEYGVDDCEGQLEENSKATININNLECNMITDTEDDIVVSHLDMYRTNVLCTVQWYFWCVRLRSDARRVRWHSTDVNLKVAVTLLRGDVIISTCRKS